MLPLETTFELGLAFGRNRKNGFVHVWYVFDLFYILYNFFAPCTLHLLSESMYGSDALITEPESSWSEGWSFDQIHIIRCYVFLLFPSSPNQVFLSFLSLLTCVGKFSISLIPNRVVFKEFYLTNEEPQDCLLQATFTMEVLTVHSFVSALLSQGHFMAIFSGAVRVFWFRRFATMGNPLYFVHKRRVAW